MLQGGLRGVAIINCHCEPGVNIYCHPEGFIPKGSEDSSDTVYYCPQNDWGRGKYIFNDIKSIKTLGDS